eukprot:TRINITY_DN2967_c0_g1_i1.p1 TRINITY_DN2967_c0_g1~~TRINITY_DN2967_c0_g1_i1.p1  ORF type:complete len:245 (+),score=57.35 TRINITY_DN2967_c0_g1_i1:14-748(+)
MERSKRRCMRPSFSDLPEELIDFIFRSFLDVRDVCMAEMVCKDWKRIISDKNFVASFWMDSFQRKRWFLRPSELNPTVNWKEKFKQVTMEVEKVRSQLKILRYRQECTTPPFNNQLSESDIACAEHKLANKEGVGEVFRFSPPFREYIKEFGKYGLELFNDKRDEVIYFKALDSMMSAHVVDQKLSNHSIGIAYLIRRDNCQKISIYYDTKSESFGQCFTDGQLLDSFEILLQLIVSHVQKDDF